MIPEVIYHKLDLSPLELRKQIKNERLLVADHSVKITTLDGQTHEFIYRRVEEGQIVGDKGIVAIDHVAALEISQHKFEYPRQPNAVEETMTEAEAGAMGIILILLYLFYGIHTYTFPPVLF